MAPSTFEPLGENGEGGYMITGITLPDLPLCKATGYTVVKTVEKGFEAVEHWQLKCDQNPIMWPTNK